MTLDDMDENKENSLSLSLTLSLTLFPLIFQVIKSFNIQPKILPKSKANKLILLRNRLKKKTKNEKS
jgi:hypothetical protein